MKVCVFGASGYIGSTIFTKLKTQSGLNLVGTTLDKTTFQDIKQVDVNDPEAFSSFYKVEKPDVVIWSLMAGSTESNLSNQGLIHLMTHLEPSTKLIYISSDYVFSQGNGPYLEEDSFSVLPEDHALSNYANAKVKAEKFIQHELSNYLILRAGPVYGKNGLGRQDAQTRELVDALKNNRVIFGREDIIRTFVNVNDLATVIAELLTTTVSGVLHVGPEKSESYYEFMKARAIEYGYDPSLVKIDVSKSTQINTPKNMALNTDKFRNVSRTNIKPI